MKDTSLTAMVELYIEPDGTVEAWAMQTGDPMGETGDRWKFDNVQDAIEYYSVPKESRDGSYTYHKTLVQRIHVGGMKRVDFYGD